MTTPLDALDLPDIDEELSSNSSTEANYEPHPYQEPNTSTEERNKDESLQQLEKKITEHHIPHHDIVTPSGGMFPEEYQVETDTGLVRSTTVMSLQRSRNSKEGVKRSDSAGGKSGSDQGGLTKEKLDKAVERNRRALEKNRKRGKGLFSKIKEMFT